MNRLTYLTRYLTATIRHRRFVLCAIAAVTTALIVGASRVVVEVDPAKQLPQAHPYVQSFHEVHRLFGDWNLVMIGLRPHTGAPFEPSFLQTVSSITTQISALPGLEKPLLQSIASENTKLVTADSQGLSVVPAMREIPDSPEAAAALRARILSDRTFERTIVSHDGSTLAIYATFELTPELPGYVNLHHAVLDILKSNDDGTFEYFLSGPVVIASFMSTYAEQVAYLFPLALLIIGLVHYDAFRTWQAVTLPLLTGLLAVVWAVGLMGYFGVALDPLNSTTPVLILAVGAGHAVQVLKRYYETLGRLRHNEAAIVDSMTKIGPIMLASGGIATLSFLSLAFLGTDSMRTFGLFTGFGIAAAVGIEMTLIPALRAELPLSADHEWDSEAGRHPTLASLLKRIASVLSSKEGAKAILVTYGGIIAVSALFALRIEVDTSFKRNFSPTDRVRLDDTRLNELFGGTNSLIFTISGERDGSIATPEAVDAIATFQRRINALPGVGKTISLVDTIEQLHSAITGRTDEMPRSAELISQYLFLYSLSGGNDLNTRLTPDHRSTKLVVMLHEDSTRFGEEVISNARTIAADELPEGFSLSVAGSVASNAALTEVMVRGKALNILQIAAITISVSAMIFRSILAGFLVAVPLAVAVVVNFGVMGLLGIRLDIATSAVTAMAVGIGADYAVYFLFRLREEYCRSGDYAAALEESLTTSGKAVLYVSIAVALGYSVLCLSTFRLFVQLGSLVGLAMLVSSLATLLVLPALLTTLVRLGWTERVLGAPTLRDGPMRIAKNT